MMYMPDFTVAKIASRFVEHCLSAAAEEVPFPLSANIKREGKEEDE